MCFLTRRRRRRALDPKYLDIRELYICRRGANALQPVERFSSGTRLLRRRWCLELRLRASDSLDDRRQGITARPALGDILPDRFAIRMHLDGVHERTELRFLLRRARSKRVVDRKERYGLLILLLQLVHLRAELFTLSSDPLFLPARSAVAGEECEAGGDRQREQGMRRGVREATVVPHHVQRRRHDDDDQDRCGEDEAQLDRAKEHDVLEPVIRRGELSVPAEDAVSYTHLTLPTS